MNATGPIPRFQACLLVGGILFIIAAAITIVAGYYFRGAEALFHSGSIWRAALFGSFGGATLLSLIPVSVGVYYARRNSVSTSLHSKDDQAASTVVGHKDPVSDVGASRLEVRRDSVDEPLHSKDDQDVPTVVGHKDPVSDVGASRLEVRRDSVDEPLHSKDDQDVPTVVGHEDSVSDVGVLRLDARRDSVDESLHSKDDQDASTVVGHEDSVSDAGASRLDARNGTPLSSNDMFILAQWMQKLINNQPNMMKDQDNNSDAFLYGWATHIARSALTQSQKQLCEELFVKTCFRKWAQKQSIYTIYQKMINSFPEGRRQACYQSIQSIAEKSISTAMRNNKLNNLVDTICSILDVVSKFDHSDSQQAAMAGVISYFIEKTSEFLENTSYELIQILFSQVNNQLPIWMPLCNTKIEEKITYHLQNANYLAAYAWALCYSPPRDSEVVSTLVVGHDSEIGLATALQLVSKIYAFYCQYQLAQNINKKDTYLMQACYEIQTTSKQVQGRLYELVKQPMKRCIEQLFQQNAMWHIGVYVLASIPILEEQQTIWKECVPTLSNKIRAAIREKRIACITYLPRELQIYLYDFLVENWVANLADVEIVIDGLKDRDCKKKYMNAIVDRCNQAFKNAEWEVCEKIKKNLIQRGDPNSTLSQQYTLSILDVATSYIESKTPIENLFRLGLLCSDSSNLKCIVEACKDVYPEEMVNLWQTMIELGARVDPNPQSLYEACATIRNQPEGQQRVLYSYIREAIIRLVTQSTSVDAALAVAEKIPIFQEKQQAQIGIYLKIWHDMILHEEAPSCSWIDTIQNPRVRKVVYHKIKDTLSLWTRNHQFEVAMRVILSIPNKELQHDCVNLFLQEVGVLQSGNAKKALLQPHLVQMVIMQCNLGEFQNAIRLSCYVSHNDPGYQSIIQTLTSSKQRYQSFAECLLEKKLDVSKVCCDAICHLHTTLHDSEGAQFLYQKMIAAYVHRVDLSQKVTMPACQYAVEQIIEKILFLESKGVRLHQDIALPLIDHIGNAYLQALREDRIQASNSGINKEFMDFVSRTIRHMASGLHKNQIAHLWAQVIEASAHLVINEEKKVSLQRIQAIEGCLLYMSEDERRIASAEMYVSVALNAWCSFSKSVIRQSIPLLNSLSRLFLQQH